jgi:uncharacterized membrane protein
MSTLFRVVPAVAFAWILYHLVIWSGGDAAPADILARQLTTIPLVNGGSWSIRTGDIVILLTVITGFYEVVKTGLFIRTQVWDHTLSALLFAVALTEFLTMRTAQTSEFFFIVVALFCDLTAGFVVGLRVARRDVAIGGLTP